MKTVNRNKNVFIRLVLISLFGLFMIGKRIMNESLFGPDANWISTVFLIFIGLFLPLMIINSVYELLKPNVALEISPEGINDQVSFREAGFVAWEHIEDVYMDTSKRKPYLIIKLKPDFELQTKPSILRRALARKDVEAYGHAISINRDYVKEDLNSILKMINEVRPNLEEI